MTEREIADLILSVKRQKDYIDYLKRIIKDQDHKIQELSILLDKKIKFRNEVKKCQKQ